MAKLLVIGGTGFFGKSILDAFQRGLIEEWCIDKVIIMARNPSKLKVEAPELLSPKVDLIADDICTTDVLPDADYVIHAAASTDASRYLSDGDEEKRNIIQGTINYCALAPKFHKSSKIVLCSSGAVYGQQPTNIEFLKENMDFGDAEGLADAKKGYAFAKRDSESIFKDLAFDKGMNVSIARCFAFAGKYLPRDQHFAFGNFIADGLASRPIKVLTDKKVYRSYMYADDLVRWLMTLAHHSNCGSPIYNVGSDIKIEVRDLARLVAKHFNVDTDILHEPDERAGIDMYIPSILKARQKLNLSCNDDLEKIMAWSAL